MSSGHRRGGRGRGRGVSSGCHRCGQAGHFARECRSSGRGRSRSKSRVTSHQMIQPRSDERRYFDKLTKSEDATISCVNDAIRFVNAALSYATTEGGSALLYRLNEAAGSSALRKCLEYITTPPMFDNGFLALLERLAQDDLNKPVYDIPLNSVISKLYELPFLIPSIKSLVPDWIQGGSNDRRTVLAWFLAKVTLSNTDARTNVDVLSIAERLTNFGCGDHLKTILGGNLVTTVSLSQIRDNQTETPGGRHDNDMEDYRSINIVPSCQEFLSDADPYLPLPLDKDQNTEASLLDRQFRLIREDILGPSKAEKDDPRKQQRDIFHGARPVAVESGFAILNNNGDRIVGDTDPCIMCKFEMPKWFRVNSMRSAKEKAEYWDKNRRILAMDALVCLERKNEHGVWEPIRFGTIVRREARDLLSQPPKIGIAFDSAEDWDDSLMELSDRSLRPSRLVIVSADLFAYQPILKGLQMMTEIPFKHEIVNAKPSLPVGGDKIEIPDKLNSKVAGLDAGQSNALDAALKDRVALIQGECLNPLYMYVYIYQDFLKS